jgi:GT2 family glycosyltransferase
MEKVRIIIPNADGEQWLKQCLDAVFSQDYKSFTVTMVDNASMDDSVKLVEENYPQVEIIRHLENIGTCASVNQVVITAQEEYIAVLHNDAVPDKSWLREMVAQMSQDDKIFALAPVVKYHHNPERVKQAGIGYTLACTPFVLNHGKKVAKIKPKHVFAAPDCGVLYRRTMFQRANGYDDKFFMLHHDIDICWRASKLGFKTAICPNAHMIRLRELGWIDPDTRARLEARNNLWTIHKNMPPCQKFFTALGLACGNAQRKSRFPKNARKSYKEGIIEGKRTKKRLMKRFTPHRGMGIKQKIKCGWYNKKIKWSMIKYSFINIVRFPK